MGLSRKLTPGQMFDLTLQFKHQGAVPIQVKVEMIGSMGGNTMKDGAKKDSNMHSGHGQ
jgi:copper(I)-binding protein